MPHNSLAQGPLLQLEHATGNEIPNPVQIPLKEMDSVSKEVATFRIFRWGNEKPVNLLRFIAVQTEASFVAKGVWKSRGDSRMEWGLA